MTDSNDEGRKRLPVGVKKVRGRNGAIYHYLETEEGRVRITGEPGTAEFDKSLREAQRRRPATLSVDDFDSLIKRFIASPENKKTAPATQKLRQHALALISKRFGTMAVADFNDRRIREDIYSFHDDLSDTPRMADVAIDTLSRLLNWSYDRGGAIEVNHALRIKHFIPNSGRNRAKIIWTDNERVKFLAETEAAVALAFQCLFFSGARVGDAGAWKWSQYDGQWLVFTPTKTRSSTGVEIHLPVFALPPFKMLLDSIPRRSDHILTTANGKPWLRTYLTERFIDERNRIFGEGFNRHLHDLRGTIATKLVDAGCTDREVSAITGHVTAAALSDMARSMSSYVAATRKQAANAFSKWYAAEFAPKGDVVQLPRRA